MILYYAGIRHGDEAIEDGYRLGEKACKGNRRRRACEIGWESMRAEDGECVQCVIRVKYIVNPCEMVLG